MTPSRRPPPTHFRTHPVAETEASLSFCNPKLALKIHSAVLTAPAAHSKRLYRKCSGIRLALLSNFICRSTSDRELAFHRYLLSWKQVFLRPYTAGPAFLHRSKLGQWQ